MKEKEREHNILLHTNIEPYYTWNAHSYYLIIVVALFFFCFIENYHGNDGDSGIGGLAWVT